MPSSFSPDEVVSSIFKKFEGEWLTPEFIRDESNRLCDALSAAHIGDPGRTAREFQSQGIVQKDKEKATAFQYDSANSDKPFKPMQNLYDSEDFNQETYELLKYLDDLRRQISKEHCLQKVKQILNWKSPLSKQELPPDLFAELSTQKPSQVIFYGVPGSGKSHFIHDKLRDCDKSQILRTVFHPEYTNADFVGQIRPEVDDGGNARYKFHPGPFPRILERAFKNPGEHFYLVIEEINRGNAAAIFGDIFQLFDRDDSGESRYPIWNEDIAQTVFRDASEPIRLPANLSVIATMNTSDQNVFSLDNAFLRRFDLVMIPNEIPNPADSAVCEFRSEEIQKQAAAFIESTNVRWRIFWERINEKILQSNQGIPSSEDKRMGLWFVKNQNGKISRKTFSNKVLKYLWDEAFKFHRWELFRNEIRSLESLIRSFENGDDPWCVFKDDFKNFLLEKTQTDDDSEKTE